MNFFENRNTEFSRKITKIAIYVLQQKCDHKKLLQKNLKVWRYSIIKVDSFEISKTDSVVVEKSDCRNLNNFWNLVEIMYKNFISVWVFRKGRLTDNHQKDNNLIFST